MSLLNAFRKLFSKRKRFAPPNQYKLNSKERESVIVFLGLAGTLVINVVFILISR